MDILVLNGADVHRLLDMETCMAQMEAVLRSLARGEAMNPLRRAMWLPDRRGLLGLMPGALPDDGVMGVKVISVFPANTGYPSHQGMVMLFETTHGRPLALVDAMAVTAVRTAAVSGVATRMLARPDAACLALLGSGEQAETHLEAMCAVRPILSVRVWSRTAAHAHRFAGRMTDRYGLPVTVHPSPREAVDGADVICTVTAAREPILEGRWLRPGVHVNAVGASAPVMRELDTEAIRKARLFVDRRESALRESGALIRAMEEGVVTREHIRAELGDLLLGDAEGRRSADDITVFKSLGLAVEDLAPTLALYEQARAEGVGQRIDW